jgi:tripartite-type tricarboxylate transporter receptor subunit TctC
MKLLTVRKAVAPAIAAVMALASCCIPLHAFAQAYPSRPVEMIVPWGPGGGSDQTGREVAKLLEGELKVSLPVINAPGATGNAGIQKMLAGTADGYSIAVLSADTLYANLTGGTQKWTLNDLTAIAVMIQQPSGFYVAENSRFKTWADVEKEAKTGSIKVGISGFGSPDDITIGYFIARGFKMNPVPFANPSERYASLMGGHSDIMYSPLGNIRGMTEGKQVRPIIVFGNKRVPEYKDVPCSKELGYDVALPQFRTVVVKAGTDPQRVKVIADALARVYANPDYKAFLKSQIASEDSFVAAKDARAFMQGEFDSVKKVMAASVKK